MVQWVVGLILHVVKLKNNKKYHLGKYFHGNRKKMLKSIYCHEIVVKLKENIFLETGRKC